MHSGTFILIELTCHLESENIGSSKTIQFLHLAEWVDNNISREQYESLRKIIKNDFDVDLPSLCRRDGQLKNLSGLEGREIDCCIPGCMAYTGIHANKVQCEFCQKPRYLINPGE